MSFENSFFDTKVLAKKLKEANGWDNITLPYLAEYYQVEQKEAHRAWCDAEANAKVYFMLKRSNT